MNDFTDDSAIEGMVRKAQNDFGFIPATTFHEYEWKHSVGAEIIGKAARDKLIAFNLIKKLKAKPAIALLKKDGYLKVLKAR